MPLLEHADNQINVAMLGYADAPEVMRMQIVTIGVDPLLTEAIASDWPQASVCPKPGDPRCWDGPAPDMVVLNRAASDHTIARAMVWHRWGPGVVVAEVDAGGPWAVVWRSPTIGTVVEIGPGFLAPFVTPARTRT